MHKPFGTPLARLAGLLALAIFLSACQPACPPGSVQYIVGAPPEQASQPQVLEASPQEIEIRAFLGSKTITVDQVVEGFLCDDTWQGTVYVTCNVEIPAWEGEAFFFQDCKPLIEPGAMIYVAAHNDKPYSEGCTCHE
jgi:hypothetical protein